MSVVLLLTMAGLLAGIASAQTPAPATAPAAAAATKPASAPASAPAGELKVVRYQSAEGVTVATLDNGLTVAIKEVRSLPVVDVRAFVHTGALYEGKWLGAGISHLLEHLVAEGAEHDMGSATAEEVRQSTGRVQQIGGQSNAYTSDDVTSYFISAAASKAGDCIDLVADWMARPQITEADFRREHGVVQRELEMGEDEPGRVFWYARAANVYRGHPAEAPVIGYKAPLAALKYEDVLAYHSQAYVPQNMVLAIVGDVDAAAALSRVRQAFAGFQQGRAVQHVLPEVQPLAGVRRAVVPNANVKEVTEAIDFITIPLVHEDLCALDVLSYIMSQGESSRLAVSIIRDKQLATAVDTSSATPPWGRGTFTVQFRTSPQKADAAEEAVLAQLRKLVDEGVGEAELARAKRQKVADFIYSQQTVESQASTIGSDLLTTGDVNFSKNYTSRIQAVTAKAVQQAAAKYLTFDAMAITRMTPAQRGATTAAATQPASRPASAPQTFTMPNGLKVVVRPMPGSGLVSMVFATKGGVLVETPQTNGIGSLMAEVATRGAGDLTAEQIDDFFDNAGGGLKAECGNNSWYWQATVLADSGQRAMEILADVVQRPTFSQKELDIQRPAALAAIDRVDESWHSQLMKFYRSGFFGQQPYSRLAVGDADVVKAATAADLKRHHQQYIRAGASVLAIYGDVDPQKAAQAATKLFAAVPPGENKLPQAPAAALKAASAPATQPASPMVLKTSNTQAGVIVAAPGMTITDLQDRFPIDVLDTIISGYHLPSGWLHNELRGKRLVYVVHASNWAGLLPGAFVVYAGTQPANASQVVQIIEKDLKAASNYEPTQQEIDLAVNTILTAELLGNQSVASLALSGAIDELYGLGYDFRMKLEQNYRAVKPQDVLRVGRKYLSGDYRVFITTPQPEALARP
jgi:zinc protease